MKITRVRKFFRKFFHFPCFKKAKVEGRECRICHHSLDAGNQDSGVPIELGCSCKGDLAAAHKQCAETWFRTRGNRTCEICRSIARNVAGVDRPELVEQWYDANDAAVVTVAAPVHPSETRNFWQGHRFFNFLLQCMVFAFVICWLFHFNVPTPSSSVGSFTSMYPLSPVKGLAFLLNTIGL